ncbi:MAG TPA: SGNH/GDSL hydrolase family protein, partial [Candidatus Methylacidiphilales bacterium]
MKALPPLLLLACLLLPAAASRADGAKEPAKGPYKRILFIGDSITQHTAKPELGWSGTWGMAASAEEKDYVHLLLARIAQSQGAEPTDVLVAAEGGGKIPDKLPFLARYAGWRADLAIVQLGENDNKDVTEEGFEKPYGQILEALRNGNPSGTIVCVGVWSPPNGNAMKDAMIKAECRKYGALFADLKAANADPANRAAAEKLFTHPGVLWHPGDKGMEAYAEAIFAALSTTPPADESSPASKLPPMVLAEDWSGKEGLLGWRPAPVLVDDGGKRLLKVASDDAAKTVIEKASLPAAQLAGRTVVLRTRVKGEGLTDKPQRWNGVKLMFRLRNAEGQTDFPQFHLPVGTFDWTPVEWTIRIPDNIVDVELDLGLEA